MKKSIVHTKYHLLLLTSLIKGGKDPCLSLKKYECITDNFSGQTTYLSEHRKKTKIYCAFFVPQLRHLENELWKDLYLFVIALNNEILDNVSNAKNKVNIFQYWQECFKFEAKMKRWAATCPLHDANFFSVLK